MSRKRCLGDGHLATIIDVLHGELTFIDQKKLQISRMRLCALSIIINDFVFLTIKFIHIYSADTKIYLTVILSYFNI